MSERQNDDVDEAHERKLSSSSHSLVLTNPAAVASQSPSRSGGQPHRPSEAPVVPCEGKTKLICGQ